MDEKHAIGVVMVVLLRGAVSAVVWFWLGALTMWSLGCEPIMAVRYAFLPAFGMGLVASLFFLSLVHDG